VLADVHYAKMCALIDPGVTGRHFLCTGVQPCRLPAVKNRDDYEPGGQPEVLPDVDYAELCGFADAECAGMAIP